ncbi:DNA/RNA nuclease SfsA [Alteromonas pelagimontana]|uniref:Sugar fermentation stimulation protein homolog n=1 Tax=Alteromonas pelagimontana TaxID=1858656 RepID=A0A6M4MEA9_9ALTE|nr:DNA/RNA nuclease SfsA [Alteromonas pelagimontana]QJR81439.1 DNA/RNA nuclease SfsA [Alteromonas pelagimontana]
MQFITPLVRGQLIRRYKRFLADVKLESGETIIAHCPNTGAMTNCAEPGFTVYLSESASPKRKLKYTWELAQNFDGHFIGINTHNANKLVAEALNNKSLPLFNCVSHWKAEVTPPGADSRFDFMLQEDSTIGYMEVKSVTLAQSGIGYFPDAKTSRGLKHCNELARLAKQGVSTKLLFCVQHTGIQEVRIAELIDPEYATAVSHARRQGVEICAVGCSITKEKIAVNQTLPVIT